MGESFQWGDGQSQSLRARCRKELGCQKARKVIGGDWLVPCPPSLHRAERHSNGHVQVRHESTQRKAVAGAVSLSCGLLGEPGRCLHLVERHDNETSPGTPDDNSKLMVRQTHLFTYVFVLWCRIRASREQARSQHNCHGFHCITPTVGLIPSRLQRQRSLWQVCGRSMMFKPFFTSKPHLSLG